MTPEVSQPSEDWPRLLAVGVAAEELSRMLRALNDEVGGKHLPEYSILRELELLDEDLTVGDTAALRRMDRDEYISVHGRVVGASEALDRVTDRISVALSGGSLKDETKLYRSAEVLREHADRLITAVGYLQRFWDRVRGEEAIRQRVESFDEQVSDLQSKIVRAASEFGLGGDRLQWGIYAQTEFRMATRWRAGALTTLFAATCLSIVAMLHLVSKSSNELSDLALKVVAVASVGAIGAFAASQSSEHRREGRIAQRVALDLVTVELFVEGLSPASRDSVLREFAINRFSVLPPLPTNDQTTAGGAGATQLALQLIEAARKKP